MVSGHATHRSELTTNQETAIGLKSHGQNRAIRTSAGVKRGVKHAISPEAGDVITVGAIDRGKFAADEHHAVALKGNSPDGAVCANARVERGIQGAVAIEA